MPDGIDEFISMFIKHTVDVLNNWPDGEAASYCLSLIVLVVITFVIITILFRM